MWFKAGPKGGLKVAEPSSSMVFGGKMGITPAFLVDLCNGHVCCLLSKKEHRVSPSSINTPSNGHRK